MTVECINVHHDHTTPIDGEGVDVDPPIPMLCNDCKLPTHYDSTVESYVHDDPDAPPCFLVREWRGTSCRFLEVLDGDS